MTQKPSNVEIFDKNEVLSDEFHLDDPVNSFEWNFNGSVALRYQFEDLIVRIKDKDKD